MVSFEKQFSIKKNLLDLISKNIVFLSSCKLYHNHNAIYYEKSELNTCVLHPTT